MELKGSITKAIITVILINIGICINIPQDPRDPRTCVPRRKNMPPNRCKKSCLRDTDCKGLRKCWCDGLCGPSCIRINSKCPKLPDIPNGRVLVENNKFLAIANYTCNAGYAFRNNSTTRVCQGDGTWTGREPSCQPSTIKCPPPPKVPNTYNNAPSSEYWFPIMSMYVYDCLTGYQPQPGADTHAFCLQSGQWQGPNINCTHDGCVHLGDIENGWVEQVRPNYRGTVAKYYCKTGFQLNGSAEKLCNEDGQWVGSTPTCDKVTCGSPPMPGNSMYVRDSPHFEGRFDEFTVGQRVVYKCKYGYRSNGADKYAVCGDRGQWIGPTLKCEAQNCGPPGELTYGRIKADSGYASPSRVIFFCDKGFLLKGHSDSMCQPSGHWSNPVPTCEPINCPPLQAPFHGYMEQTGISYGSVVRFHCEVGYKLRGPGERRCRPDKTWEGNDVRCEEIDCGEIFFANGRLFGDRTTFGSQITYQCKDYTTYGGIHTPFTATCLEDGSWSNPPPKCLAHCRVPDIKNATILGSQGYQYEKHGNVIEYRCNKGFTATDSTRMVCNNGTWSSRGGCVPAPCPYPPKHLPNGIRVYLNKGHGDKARYQCNSGFRMSGLADGTYQTCQYGQWRGGEPVCEEIYCPSPTRKPILNGKVWKKGSKARFIFKEYIIRIRHGDMMEYECDEGFQIDGSEGATCVDGAWQPPLQDPDTKCVPALHPPFIKLWKRLPNILT